VQGDTLALWGEGLTRNTEWNVKSRNHYGYNAEGSGRGLFQMAIELLRGLAATDRQFCADIQSTDHHESTAPVIIVTETFGFISTCYVKWNETASVTIWW
jgi:hypothetical protein